MGNRRPGRRPVNWSCVRAACCARMRLASRGGPLLPIGHACQALVPRARSRQASGIVRSPAPHRPDLGGLTDASSRASRCKPYRGPRVVRRASGRRQRSSTHPRTRAGSMRPSSSRLTTAARAAAAWRSIPGADQRGGDRRSLRDRQRFVACADVGTVARSGARVVAVYVDPSHSRAGPVGADIAYLVTDGSVGTPIVARVASAAEAVTISRTVTSLVTSVDYQQDPITYQEGRAFLARPEEWGQLVDLPRARRLRVLDVGAGTASSPGLGPLGAPRAWWTRSLPGDAGRGTPVWASRRGRAGSRQSRVPALCGPDI